MLDIRFAASPPSLPQPHSGPVCPIKCPSPGRPHCPVVSSSQHRPCSPLPGYLRKVLRNHTAHTCDGEQLLIVCPRKTTISILGAFYGRRVPSPNLCPSPGNASQERSGTSCVPPPKLLAECQDQQWCQFLVHSQVFGPDPCPGTHKYLIASYKCRPGNHRVKTVCENDKLRLQCRPKSILAIYSANYGRFLRASRAECLAPDALRRVSKKCHRKGNCTVAADRATFGDPCLPGTKKQLRVSYTCGEKQWGAPCVSAHVPLFAAGGWYKGPRFSRLREDRMIFTSSLAAFAHLWGTCPPRLSRSTPGSGTGLGGWLRSRDGPCSGQGSAQRQPDPRPLWNSQQAHKGGGHQVPMLGLRGAT
uniref:SUEL-type lectin domain-containing protein n=1 Tax=Buteo japonicus TaxID=224669 RepID=A0A8C0AQ69_9AVES